MKKEAKQKEARSQEAPLGKSNQSAYGGLGARADHQGKGQKGSSQLHKSQTLLTKAPTRIDLAGGTLDLWPLYLCTRPNPKVDTTDTLYPKTDRGVFGLTLNLAIDLFTSVHLEVNWEGSKTGLELQSLDQQEQAFFTWDQVMDRAFEKKVAPGLILPFRIFRDFFARPKLEPLPLIRASLKAGSPNGAGLGGSSCLAVALASSLEVLGRGLAGKQILEAHLELSEGDLLNIIQWVQSIETQILQIPTGLQDYLAPAFGGLQALYWELGSSRREVLPESLAQFWMQRCLVFFSGQTRSSGMNNWQIYKHFLDGKKETVSALNDIALASELLNNGLRELEGLLKTPAKAEQHWLLLLKVVRKEWKARLSLAPTMESSAQAQFHEQLQLNLDSDQYAVKVCGAGGGGCSFVLMDPNVQSVVLDIAQKAGLEPLKVQSDFKGLTLQLR